MKKYVALILLLSLTLVSSLTSCAKNKNGEENMLAERPYLTVRINVSGCNYEIRVNGVPIMTEKRGYPVVVAIPVNQWMFSGGNQLSMILTPLPGEKDITITPDSCMTLQVKESGAPRSTTRPISTFCYQGEFTLLKKTVEKSSPAGRFNSKKEMQADPDGDVVVSHVQVAAVEKGTGVMVSRNISINLPFPQWKWVSGDFIPDNDQSRQALFLEYKKMWDMLNNKDIKSVMSFVQEKIKESAISLNQEEKLFAEETELDYMDAFDSTKFKLFPLDLYNLDFFVYGDGRLAELKMWNGAGAFVFSRIDGSGSSSYHDIFRKSGDKWVLCR